MNVNVLTRTPPPTLADFDGFSLMHAAVPTCVPISSCLPNAFQPKLDDGMALSRLYPVTTKNQTNFPGKRLFFENTIRIHGSVLFGDSSGHAGQPIQGINVVARWIDPATGKPSRRFAASSVSGFLFRRNYEGTASDLNFSSAGRPVKRSESNDTALEGFFDLAGLPIPDGSSSAQYELSVETLDPYWSRTVSPYVGRQTQQSGSAAPLIVSASIGSDVQQDIFVGETASPKRKNFQPTYPNALPGVLVLPPRYRSGFPAVYGYHGQILSGNSVVPSRASAAGGTALAIRGSGLTAGTTVVIGQSAALVMSISAGRLLVSAPPMRDGVQDISLYDPADGSASTMPGALTYGAGPSDTIHLIPGSNPPTPIGGQASAPVTVRVLAADGSTPVSGASVFFHVVAGGVARRLWRLTILHRPQRP